MFFDTTITPLAPGATDFFKFDFTQWCAANGDTIVSATLSSDPAGLTIWSPVVASNAVTVRISAPVMATTNAYKLECAATTAGGRLPIKAMLIPVFV